MGIHFKLIHEDNNIYGIPNRVLIRVSERRYFDFINETI